MILVLILNLQLSLAREDRRNSTKLYNPIQLKELQDKFPNLDWLEYFNTIVDIKPEINENEIIIMSNETMFVKLHKLLESTPKRFVMRSILIT